VSDAPATRRPRGRPRSAASADAPAPIKALDRGLALLRRLADEERATLTNIALETGLTPPSAYRVLITLQRHGFAEFDESTQEWGVGIEAFRVGNGYLVRTGLLELARAPMRTLMQSTQETANLAVADGGDVVFIAQVEARHPVRAFFEAGARGHVHASGIGKALLAERSREELESLIRRRGLPRFTARTLDTREALFADLALTRERGWSLDDEERHEGMRCIAAPIFDATGRAVAGLSISGPTVRFPDAALARLGARVRAAADEVTHRLGG